MPTDPKRPATGGGRSSERERLDQALVSRGLCPSREQAQRFILAGSVRLNSQLADKPGKKIRADDKVELQARERYASRGGLKLEHALEHFGLEVNGLTALDIGASTGGFTDCLLQRGAAHIYAVDVGRGQLAWKLRQDPRVIVREGVNARHLTRQALEATLPLPSLAVIDCSFISLRKILPSTVELLDRSAMMVALIKPQFEAGREEANRGQGVITDPRIHHRVVSDLNEFVSTLPGCRWRGVTESPLRGPAGNTEFLACIEKTA